MILAIDTTSGKKATAVYWPKKIEKSLVWQSIQVDPLVKIDNLLEGNHLSASDINFVAVNYGPGSFTGIRQGLTIANTWGKIKGVPVIGLSISGFDIIKLAKKAFNCRKSVKKGVIIQPFYGKKPNISKSKKDFFKST